MAQSQETVLQAPASVDAVSRSIYRSVVDIWASFVEHIPYLIAGLLVLVATWLVARLIEWLVSHLLGRWRKRESLKELAVRVSSIGTWALGILFSAMVVFPGLTPTKALGGLGLASIAIGFAFKDIFENFFAGVLMLWRFPFENGDFIECEGIIGRVERINVRMTQLRKSTGELVVVPNSFLFKNPVEILTSRPKRRVSIITGIGYSESVDEAVALITQTLEQCDTVEQDQSPEVFPQAFGSSSIDIEVAWWTGATPLDVRRSRGEVVTAIKAALDGAGIEIPFPYRTLTFKEPVPIARPED